MTLDTETQKIEELYNTHFVPEEAAADDDENMSLLQPSPLKYIDSFTTPGVTDDLLICKE